MVQIRLLKKTKQKNKQNNQNTEYPVSRETFSVRFKHLNTLTEIGSDRMDEIHLIMSGQAQASIEPQAKLDPCWGPLLQPIMIGNHSHAHQQVQCSPCLHYIGGLILHLHVLHVEMMLLYL